MKSMVYRSKLQSMTQVNIISGQATQYLSEKIADFYGQPLADIKLKTFSDGEM